MDIKVFFFTLLLVIFIMLIVELIFVIRKQSKKDKLKAEAYDFLNSKEGFLAEQMFV